jgi:hypothetical protein
MNTQVIFVKPKHGKFVAKARGLHCISRLGPEAAARKMAMIVKGGFGPVPCLNYWEIAEIKLEQLGPLAFRAEWL